MAPLKSWTHGKEFRHHNSKNSPKLRKDSEQHIRRENRPNETCSGGLGFHLSLIFHFLLHIYQEKEPEKVKHRYSDTLTGSEGTEDRLCVFRCVCVSLSRTAETPMPNPGYPTADPRSSSQINSLLNPPTQPRVEQSQRGLSPSARLLINHTAIKHRFTRSHWWTNWTLERKKWCMCWHFPLPFILWCSLV